MEGHLSTRGSVSPAFENESSDQSLRSHKTPEADPIRKHPLASRPGLNGHPSLHLVKERLSLWSQSGPKRFFDCLCVVLALPILIPLSLLIALSVRLTSSGPVLFLQERVGRYGRSFTILKFRTMTHSEDVARDLVTTTNNQQFTLVGPFLRRWKLDELPQLLNVLLGDMSLVGPRPKIPEHQIGELLCRPGITGAATIAFAREETILADLTGHELGDFYRDLILPLKHKLDADYMAKATFISDFNLLLKTALRRWDSSEIDRLLNSDASLTGYRKQSSTVASSAQMSDMSRGDVLLSAQQMTGD
jgi:lipopolysaccharide/colanic/teichoic acid biosynthesis glycosyltransferase